ncbi:hypothetical protein [Herbaspirillum sp.]|uniref:ComEC/Rec2 family competence protein n=1 Tax=Herbaspirillum sp. TaxID=1890675 RepID=UPI00257B0D73|nr:hypothetical protein [Herbaspirillum sp.]
MKIDDIVRASGLPTKLKSVVTRFRAYQLGEAGASSSYFADNNFTLIEARRTEALSHKNLMAEMEICKKKTIDTLHITSWDRDHCNPPDLKWILANLHPTTVEYPGYAPHTPTGEESLRVIKEYTARKHVVTLKNPSSVCVSPTFIGSLKQTENLAYRNVFYHPKYLFEGDHSSNNNSTVKLFRTGCFNVASTGDIEHANIGSYLRSAPIFKSETDILMLPHHGASTDVVTKKFLEDVAPKVAVSNSNFANQHDHPTKAIQDLLTAQKIHLYTTKRGDVLIESVGTHTEFYRVTDYKTSGESSQHVETYRIRKHKYLSRNADSIRNHYNPGYGGKA